MKFGTPYSGLYTIMHIYYQHTIKLQFVNNFSMQFLHSELGQIMAQSHSITFCTELFIFDSDAKSESY